jgi:hypothetical protein
MNHEIPVVGDFFISLDRFPQIPPDVPISSAIFQLLQYRTLEGDRLLFDEVLVVENVDRLVGQLSIKTILKNLFPAIFANELEEPFLGKKAQYGNLSILLEGHFQDACRRQAEVIVGSCMEESAKAVERTTHPLHALEIMVGSNRSTLPVKDGKKLLGAVRMTDLFSILGSHCTISSAHP